MDERRRNEDRPDEPQRPEPPGRVPKWLSWKWLLLVWVVVIAAQLILGRSGREEAMAYTEFEERVEAGDVAEVAIGEHEIRGTFRDSVEGEDEFLVYRVEDEGLLEELRAKGVVVRGAPPERESSWWALLSWLLPVFLIAAFFVWMMRRAGGGGGALGLSAVGRSKARVYMEKDVDITFDDVAGVDEAKDELVEVIEFLRTPERFQRLGGKLPRGILLVGPPGTGKTLLSRAVAGEAGVPFFSISGSEFVEMFVGVGASRVRDLFSEAKKKAPCIVFIDELDAVGKTRGAGPMTHEEREQTLNQLLVEIDGFDTSSGVVLMAATNRPEILDKALLRAGRFDRHILVDRPDKGGRLAILGVHARGVTLSEGVDLEEIAAMTAGMAGADLANIINEAALLAVRREHDAVAQDDLREAVERVIAGLEKKNRVLTAAEKARVAHHELGHALVAFMVPGADAVHKISIIPRGIAALGYTLQLPTEDRYLLTRSELEDRIATLLGGRAAEEIVYGEISTGASDDLRKATDLARSMVEEMGMSGVLGQVSLRRPESPFLEGQLVARGASEYSEATAREIDCEVRRIIDEQYSRALRLLRRVELVLRRAGKTLLGRETISGAELRAIAGPALDLAIEAESAA